MRSEIRMMTSDELYQKFIQLKKCVPPDIQSQLAYTDHYGEKISFEIVNVNRTLAYFVAAREKLAVKNRIISKESLRESLQWRNKKGYPPKILESYIPIHVQAVNSLLKWALSSPSDLANRITKLPYIPKYMIYITIPSIFSYFSSKEAATYAFYFYKSLSSLVPIESFIYIVSPFFRSCCAIHKFSRVVFDSLFWSAYLSPEYSDDPTRFAQKLIDLVVSKLPILPGPQLSLLHHLSTSWTSSQIWDLLINDLILPQFWLQFNISPFSYSNKPPFDYNKVHDMIQLKSENLSFPDLTKDEIINGINSPLDESLFEICESFSKVDEPLTIYIIMTAADIVMLRHLFDADQLPPSMKNIDPLIVDHFDKAQDDLISAYRALSANSKGKNHRHFRIRKMTQSDSDNDVLSDSLDSGLEDFQYDELNVILKPFSIKIFPKVSDSIQNFVPKPLIFPKEKTKSKNDISYDPEKNDSLQLWQAIQNIATEHGDDPIQLIMRETPPRTGVSVIDKKLQSKCQIIKSESETDNENNISEIEKFRILCLNEMIKRLSIQSTQFEDLILNQLKVSNLSKWLDISNECIRGYSFLVARDILEDEALRKFTKSQNIPRIPIPDNIQIQFLGSSPPSPTSCSYLNSPRSFVQKKKESIDSISNVPTKPNARPKSFVHKINKTVKKHKKKSFHRGSIDFSVSTTTPIKKNWSAGTNGISISDGSPIYLLSSKYLLDNFFDILDKGIISTSSIIKTLSTPETNKNKKTKISSIYTSLSSSYIRLPTSMSISSTMENKPKTESSVFGFKNHEVGATNFFLALLMISKIEKSIISPFKDEINQMKESFIQLTEKTKRSFFDNSYELPTFDSRVVAKCFWDSCNILCNVDSESSLLARTLSLFAFLVQIDKITMATGSPSTLSSLFYVSPVPSSPFGNETAQKLIKFAITQGPDCFWVVITVIVLNSTIFGDERINKYIDEESIQGWQGFTVALLKVMQDDAQLVALYGSLATGDRIQNMIPNDH